MTEPRKSAKKTAEPTPRKTKAQLASERRRRNYLVFSLVMVGVLSLSALAPLFTSNIQPDQPQIQPTATTPPVLPTPISDLSTIRFDNMAVSVSGLYSVAVPTGWEIGTNIVQLNEAQLTQRNGAASSVIEARVIQPETPITSVEELPTFFNDAWLRSSWRDYTSWNKTGETVVEDRYVADFLLTRLGSQFIARQEAWTDGRWLYVVRVVTLPNASDMLRYLLNGVRQSLRVNPQIIDVPFDWQGHFDPSHEYLIRFPSTWRVTDAANGQPTSLAGEGATIRIDTVTAAVDSAEAAQQWVETTYGAAVTSVEPVERGGAAGFAVAYQLPTLDGDTTSGYAVLLRNGDNVSVADLRFSQPNVDLNSEVEGFETWQQIMNSFSIWRLTSTAA
ncbi:MAG: hypothetical protein SNJ54_16985 [Anaerolineae bacterium]